MSYLSNFKLVTPSDVKGNPSKYEKRIQEQSDPFSYKRTVEKWIKSIPKGIDVVLENEYGIIVLKKLEQYAFMVEGERKMKIVKDVFTVYHSCFTTTPSLMNTVKELLDGDCNIVYVSERDPEKSPHKLLGKSMLSDINAYMV